MHNLTKIKLFRIVLYITYPIAIIFIYPLVLLKKKNTSHLFFFFDRYTIGGAQRVYLDILNSVHDIPKQVYFTRKSPEDVFKREFFTVSNTFARDICFWCDKIALRIFTVHYYAFYINRHKKAHIFSSNSTFFYDMLPFLKKHFIKTELLHSFSYSKNGMEFFGLANYKNLSYRMLVDGHSLSNIKNQYIHYGIEKSYLNKVLLIEPGVLIPESIHKDYTLPLKVLYAGRGGPEKRIRLIDKIARICMERDLPIQFHFAGTMVDQLSDFVKKNAVIHGEISDRGRMNELYKVSHAILMTSAVEGFPMLIKEGMAYGCIPVVTALEGIVTHLRHMENAMLIFDTENESSVVNNALKNLEQLCSEPLTFVTLSENAYQYAKKHFEREKFTELYRKFLLGK